MYKSRSILVVAESIDINDSSGTKGRVALINNLKKLGYNLLVLHYTRRSVQIKGVICVPIKEKKFNLFYLLSRTRRVLKRYTSIDIFKRIEGAMGFSFGFYNDSNSIKAAVKKYNNDFDKVLTLSKGTSYRTHHAVLQLSDLHHKWIAYIHDPYPYSFFPEPYKWYEPGFKKKELFFNNVAKKSSFSIFPSLKLKEWMANFCPNFGRNGIIIPHQNLEIENKFKEKTISLIDEKKFNILHAGNLMKQRSPITLIKAFILFLKEYPEAKEMTRLFFIGNSEFFRTTLEKYQDEIEQLIVINKNLDFDLVNEIQRRVFVNVIIESQSDVSPFLPGKFPHCVFANKEIMLIGPKNSEINRLLNFDYPFSAESNDEFKIKKIIELLYVKWKTNHRIPLDNTEFLRNYLGIDYLKAQMDILFLKQSD